MIVIHGNLRDGYSYWNDFNTIIQQQKKVPHSGIDPNLILVAPEFYSTILNSGLYGATDLAWGDVNVWQAGQQSNHPNGARISSFEVVKRLVDHFDDRTMYPNMKNITLVGHSGGAQMVGRYAIVVPTMPTNAYMRFIVADPSSNAYFTQDRPITDPAYATKQSCKQYNDWRYGFNKFHTPPYAGHSTKTYFTNYITRDVILLNGLLDTEPNGDQQCMAVLQGGSQRIGRNLAWWKYINLLAKSPNDVSLFPGNFSKLPDMGDDTPDKFGLRLSIVANASHDVIEVFSSPQGCSALFNDTDLDIGWRPTTPISIAPPNSSDLSPITSGNGMGAPSAAVGRVVPTMLLSSTGVLLLGSLSLL